ncbi:MAG: hypothetical protein JJE04_08980 [Acidobacteriia bacterium]|nr:hypothetical protein [Terriglobia bacterium]
MRPLPILLLFSLTVFGQGFGSLFDKAPPQVDEALRARISAFYQAHVEGKFRVADQVVHEDSKDVFFEAEKSKFRGYKIAGITYDENYTKAKVVVDAEMDFYFVGFGKMEVNRPISSLWKLDQGQWWWYVIPYDRNVGRESPFGRMKETPDVAGTPRPDLMTNLDNAPKLAEIKKSVSASRAQVELSSQQPSTEEVVITNNFAGPVTLELHVPELPGLEARLENYKLGSGSKTNLIFTYHPPNKLWRPEMEARVLAQPTMSEMFIKINFTFPPPAAKPATPAAAKP